jgi:hypothetical protein
MVVGNVLGLIALLVGAYAGFRLSTMGKPPNEQETAEAMRCKVLLWGAIGVTIAVVVLQYAIRWANWRLGASEVFRLPLALLIGLALTYRDAKAVFGFLEVWYVKRYELRPTERAGKAQEQDGARPDRQWSND